jgi:hypothetical protein
MIIRTLGNIDLDQVSSPRRLIQVNFAAVPSVKSSDPAAWAAASA